MLDQEEQHEEQRWFEFVPAERMSTSSIVGGIALTAALFGLAGFALGYRPRDFTGTSEPSRVYVPASELDPANPAEVEESLERAVASDARDVEGSVADMKYAKGYTVYSKSDGTLWAAPFNRRRSQFTGPAVQIGSQVSTGVTGRAQFSYSRRGDLAYIPEEPQWLVLVDRYGKLRNATPVRRFYYSPRFAPDSNHIAVDVLTPAGRDLFVLSLNGGGLSRADFVLAPNIPTRIAEQLELAYPAVSRDGKWIAYVSNRSGRSEVHVRSLSGDSTEVQVSTYGGTEPVWSPDGRFLFYRGIAGRSVDMIEAKILTSPSLRVESRRRMFPVNDIAAGTARANYGISPDGQTFVMVRRSPSTKIAVLKNLPKLIGK